MVSMVAALVGVGYLSARVTVKSYLKTYREISRSTKCNPTFVIG